VKIVSSGLYLRVTDEIGGLVTIVGLDFGRTNGELESVFLSEVVLNHGSWISGILSYEKGSELRVITEIYFMILMQDSDDVGLLCGKG